MTMKIHLDQIIVLFIEKHDKINYCPIPNLHFNIIMQNAQKSQQTFFNLREIYY